MLSKLQKTTSILLAIVMFMTMLPPASALELPLTNAESIRPANTAGPLPEPTQAPNPTPSVTVKETYPVPYENGKILIANYAQLEAIGTDCAVMSRDMEAFGTGVPVLTEEGKPLTYSPDAAYMVINDVALPEAGWPLPVDFTGRIYPSNTSEASVYDVTNDVIRITNIYQLELLTAENRSEFPVMTGDISCADFGTGSFIFSDGDSKSYLTYSAEHNYVLSSSFSSERAATGKLDEAKAGWTDPNAQHRDGRDYFGQAAIDIGGTTYVLIGSKAQLYAINNASDTTVYGPVYEVFQRRDSLLNWNEDNIVEETATLIYPGDADLISNIALGNGTSADFTNEPMYDGNNGILSSDRYHSLTAIPDLVGRTRTIYCTVDPTTGKYSVNSRTNPYSSLKYSKSGNYIVFRDVSLDGQAWDPLMFSGTMYGVVNDPLVQNGEMNIDTSVKPVISDFNVTVNDPINLNQYTGVGFFGTLKGTFNSSALIGNRVTVQNIKLADGSVTNNAVRTRVDETVVNLVLQGLGIVVGGLLDGLLYVLTGGRIVGVRELLTGLLNTRAKDPTSLATGGFAGRISGDAYIADCVTENVSVYSVLTNFENAVADKKIVGMGGFVGYTEGETEYEGLSGILGGLVDVLAGLLNVIPGLGLGDLINLLLENTLPVGQLIPVGYKKPVIERCGVRELTDFTMEDGKIAVGGFAGTICGTDVADCYIEDSDITVTADTFGGGFCGIARDAIIEGTLSGLGIDVLAALHPQSTMINCEIRNTPVTVTGGSHLGGFIGALANSYTINDTVDEDSPVTVSGEGEYIGGFCGLATLGTLFTLSDYLITGESLLSTVKGLVTGLLSDNQNQSLLDLGGVAPAGIMGCALAGETTVEGESCVGGFLGRGNGVRFMNSSEDNLMLLSRYRRDGTAPDVEEQNIEVENLVSVTAETDYAGGLAGYLTTANVGGLLGDTLGIGQFMPFKIMNASVTGTDGGYTVTAGGNDAGGAVGFALGGDIDLVNAYELASVTADNRAGG